MIILIISTEVGIVSNIILTVNFGVTIPWISH
jgi:hypothetical protein